MRKVWLILFTITMLVVAMALPAMAATPGSCNNTLVWSGLNSPAITQPADVSIPTNCPTGNNGTNAPINSIKLDLSQILDQLKAQFGQIGQNCPTVNNGN